MSQAYAQLLLDEDPKQYTVINTQRGLFKYNRLCFGISSAPGIFQRAMEQLLQGLPGVLCYLDDVLISGSSEKEHWDRLTTVLTKLQEAGLKLRADECSFQVSEVTYLGYLIDKDGIHPTKEKVKAIVDAPAPTCVKQLQAYLGLFNFYRRFVPKASTVLEPLNRLLRKDTGWVWGESQSKAFKASKDLLLQSDVLTHFDPNLPISVSADSSAYGVGAVISHVIEAQERPICFASRTLTDAERNYSQLEKEALAMVFAIKKFHNYLWGQANFQVVTDHKPLLGLFSNTKAIPAMASGRIQRWALMLQSYPFKLIHRSGAVLGTADALSRLPLPGTNESVPVPAEWSNLINFLDSSPVTALQIKDHTRTDPVLARVFKYCELGWPEVLKEDEVDLLPFFRKREELSIQNGCVLWGYRVVIPGRDREALLNELHAGHVGVSRMKELARCYVWWPNMDKDLEGLAKQCSECIASSRAPARAELHPWEWPQQPWHRLHVDYAGPVRGKYFLLLVDAHSKWVEIFPTKGPTADETIKYSKHCFCQMGFPVTIVSDNGPCFISREFKEFLRENGVRHITSAVYKPSTNGLVERMVQTFKSALYKTTEILSVWLDKFLFKYRITPHSTTGVSPAELMFKRRFRCRLDLLHPQDQLGGRVLARQETQKRNYSSSARMLDLHPQSPVAVRNYSSGPKWLPAVVDTQTGPLSYRCELTGGGIVKRHQDQIITRTPEKEPSVPVATPEKTISPTPPVCPEPEAEPVVEAPVVHTPVRLPSESVKPRRSTRVVKPPSRLNL